MSTRPTGKGLGECPRPSYRVGVHCGCRERCQVCGFPPHVGAHMHLAGEKPGDPPFDHEFTPSAADGEQGDGRG